MTAPTSRYSELAVKLHHAELAWDSLTPESRGQSRVEFLARIAWQHFEPEITVLRAQLEEAEHVKLLQTQTIAERERGEQAAGKLALQYSLEVAEARTFARRANELREQAERECDALRARLAS